MGADRVTVEIPVRNDERDFAMFLGNSYYK